MSFIQNKLPMISLCLFGALLVSMGFSSLDINTTSMFIVSIVMFLTCWTSAAHLLGIRASSIFVLISLIVGFSAEFMGTRYGWFFGEYYFTDALGFQLLGIPVVIPLMWFNLAYMSYVMANLMIWRTPVDTSKSLWNHFLMSFFVAMLVTAYDLAADPYMVFVVKAWVMVKTDGWWFGETIQGFFGWLFVSFVITFSFRLLRQRESLPIPRTFTSRHALIPISIYGCWMVFQMMYGFPMETRTISAFAMGIPLLCTLIGSQNWNWQK